jgi:hypothetical protein
VVFIGRFGRQRYPFVEEQYQHMVFHPRELSKNEITIFFSF